MEEWLEEDWEDIPPITTEEVQQKLLEMHALVAPRLDGIMAQCFQASRAMLVPCLTELFQWMLQLGVHPASWKTARVLPVPKLGADLHAAKGYKPIALLNVQQGHGEPYEGPHELYPRDPRSLECLPARLSSDSLH